MDHVTTSTGQGNGTQASRNRASRNRASRDRAPRNRLSPDERRSQLLDLGVRLLATRSLDELSIDLLAEEAGISRGLLYHYFGNKHAFHEAVVRRAADDLIAQTAPPVTGDPIERLLTSVTAYVDYVIANYEGYLSLVKGAAGGNEAIRQIYDDARAALTDRIFSEDAQGQISEDTPAARLLMRGWGAMTEDLVLSWQLDPTGVTREELLAMMAMSLPALVSVLPAQ
jgi:AcrR family transcriptional regulator